MIARVGSQSMTLILLLLAGRFLTVELFGVFVLASILMNFATLQMYSGIYQYVMREPTFHQTKGTALSLQILVAIGFVILTLLVSGLALLAGWGELLAALIAATAPITILSMIASWQEANILRDGDVKYYYAALLLSEFTGFVVGVVMLINDFGVWSLIASRYVAGLLMMWLFSYRAGKLPRPTWNSADVRDILRYSAGLYGNASLGFFSAYGAALILGGFMNATAVGLFRMGARTANAAFDIFAQTFRVLTWQAVGRMAREERLSSELWTRLLAVNLMIMILVLGTLSILAEDLTLILLGEDWLGMVPILQILCWVRVFSSADQIAAAQLAAAGQTKFLFQVRLVEAAILLILLLASVQFGMIAVAYALFPSTLFLNLVLLRKLMQLTETNLSQIWPTFVPGILGALASLLVVYSISMTLADANGFIQIIASAGLGVATLLIIAFVPMRTWTLETLESISTAILPAQQSET